MGLLSNVYELADIFVAVAKEEIYLDLRTEQIFNKAHLVNEHYTTRFRYLWKEYDAHQTKFILGMILYDIEHPKDAIKMLKYAYKK